MKPQLSSIWSIERILSGPATPGQRGPGCNGNEEVLCIPHSSSITIRLFSVIYRTLVGAGLTPLQRYSWGILQPQPTGQYNNKWRRCLWCNGYCRRKWTRRHEFKTWMRLIAFHIALIPLGKVWIWLFSLQLWVNSWADWFLQPWSGN